MMMRQTLSTLAAATVMALALYSPSAHSGVADKATQTDVGGIHLIVYPMDIKDMVSFVGAIPLGNAFDPASGVNLTVPDLMAATLSAGTLRQDKFAIAEQLEAMGASIQFSATPLALGINGRCLKADLPKVLQLMAEQLRTPRFSPDEVKQAKSMAQGDLMDQEQNTSARAGDAVTSAIYSPQSPNYAPPVPDMLKALAKATPADIKAFHKKYVGPAHMSIVFTGDVDPKAVQAEVGKAFAGWQGGVDFVRGKLPPQKPTQRDIKLPMDDKANVAVAVGQGTGLMATDADYLPLELGTAILGDGFTSRLMSTVRDKEGLTYGIEAKLMGSNFSDGMLAVQASFAPQLLDKGLAGTTREIRKWHESGVTAEELDARKSNFLGQTQVGLGTTAGMAGEILSYHLRGQALSEIDAFPARIKAVTKEQVNAAIKNHINPDTMVWAQAGTLPN